MGLNSLLPALVPAVIALVVVSVLAAFALAWDRGPDMRLIVRRAWVLASTFIILSVAIFWIATAMVEGPRRATIDRSLQQHQQDELQRRLRHGGH
jgi:phage-related minor tail protein